MPETPIKFQKGSVRKIPKTKKEKGEYSASMESIMSLKTHNGVVHKDLSSFQQTDQTMQLQFAQLRELRRSANNVDMDLERSKLSRKKSKVKQVVVVLPKESTATPDVENYDQSSLVPTEREKSGRGVVFRSSIKKKYEINQTDEKPYDVSMDSYKESSPLPRSYSYYQMNFTQDMNEHYQAQPIFGIHPKFKLAEMKNLDKASRNKL